MSAKLFRHLLVLFICLGILGLFVSTHAPIAHAAGIIVNDPGDTVGACAGTGTGTCTLRDAITYANAIAGTASAPRWK